MPLTSSLYVPGTLADSENVIVDVGTGFYVEKVSCLHAEVLRNIEAALITTQSKDDAVKFYNAKVEEIGGNLKDLDQIVQKKSDNLRLVEDGELRIRPRVSGQKTNEEQY